MSIARECHLQHYAALAAVLFSLAGPFAALAGESALAEQTVVVRFADLNLTAQAGVDALHQRLRTAARQVCGYRDSRNLQSVQSWKMCYSTALQNALTDAGMAILDARLQAQGLPAGDQREFASVAR